MFPPACKWEYQLVLFYYYLFSQNSELVLFCSFPIRRGALLISFWRVVPPGVLSLRCWSLWCVDLSNIFDPQPPGIFLHSTSTFACLVVVETKFGFPWEPCFTWFGTDFTLMVPLVVQLWPILILMGILKNPRTSDRSQFHVCYLCFSSSSFPALHTRWLTRKQQGF